jgi:hypothetical protein
MTFYLLNNACHLKIDLALKESLNERPRYFIGKEETLHFKIQARPTPLSTLQIGTNSDLAKSISKPEIASTHKNKQHK